MKLYKFCIPVEMYIDVNALVIAESATAAVALLKEQHPKKKRNESNSARMEREAVMAAKEHDAEELDVRLADTETARIVC